MWVNRQQLIYYLKWSDGGRYVTWQALHWGTDIQTFSETDCLWISVLQCSACQWQNYFGKITWQDPCIVRLPGTLVPKALCFTRDVFFFFRHKISELPRPIAVKLCHMIAIWVNFIMQVQEFGGPSPKKLGAKNMQNSARFQTTSDFDREYLRNGTWYPKSERNVITNDSSRVPRKSRVNFGPLSTENGMWVWTHRNCIFRETIFRPLGGAGPSNFNTHYRLTKVW